MLVAVGQAAEGGGAPPAPIELPGAVGSEDHRPCRLAPRSPPCARAGRRPADGWSGHPLTPPTRASTSSTSARDGEARRAGTVRATGTPVVLISHNLPQVMDISDRILVLFHGRLIKELRTPDASTEEVVMWITGAGLRKAPSS